MHAERYNFNIVRCKSFINWNFNLFISYWYFHDVFYFLDTFCPTRSFVVAGWISQWRAPWIRYCLRRTPPSNDQTRHPCVWWSRRSEARKYHYIIISRISQQRQFTNQRTPPPKIKKNTIKHIQIWLWQWNLDMYFNFFFQKIEGTKSLVFFLICSFNCDVGFFFNF